MTNELRNEVANRVSHLGDSEFLLTYSKSQTKSAIEIVELIEAHREPFAEGKVANIGSAMYAPPQVWEAIAAESDKAAKCELLKDSAELAELEKLEKTARAAQEAAEAKSRQLQADWSAFNSIPDRIEALNVRLAQIGDFIRELDEEKLKQQYRAAYLSIVEGSSTDRFALLFLTEAIVSRDLRVECLTELSEELQSELATVKARQKLLARKLGQKA